MTKCFGECTIVDRYTATVMRCDKIGLVGPNGAGKTTLLKLILGELQPDDGRVRVSTNLQVAYFDQMCAQLDLDKSLADTISPGSEWVEVNGVKKHVMSYLGDFLFAPERVRPANVLVLDEPTNDLDIPTLELLEELLADYDGTVLLVSHDRAFFDNVVMSVFAAEGGGAWREYVGGFSDWQIQRERSERIAEEAARQSARKRRKTTRSRKARPGATCSAR